MGVMNDAKKITGGVDLTKPKLTVSWVAGAIIAVVLIMVVYKAASWAFGKMLVGIEKGKSTVQGSSSAGGQFFYE